MPARRERDWSQVTIVGKCLGGDRLPLDGGYELQERCRLEVDDPALPYLVTIIVTAHEGRLACEAMTVRQRPGGVPVTGTGLRSVMIDSYIQRTIPDMGLVIWKEIRRTEDAVAYSLSNETMLAEVASAQRQRRPADEVLPKVARLYREALGDADPRVRNSPTATVARRLHYNRGHAARLVSMARKRGLLGPARQGRSGEAPPA